MNVGNEDEGTLVSDSFLSRDGSKGSPLLQVQSGVSVRDEAVSLGVSGSADKEPSEHGVTSVPLLGVDRRTPAPLSELWELTLKITGGGIVVEKIWSRLDVQSSAKRGKK